MDILLGFLKHPKNAANLLKASQENHMVIMTIITQCSYQCIEKIQI